MILHSSTKDILDFTEVDVTSGERGGVTNSLTANRNFFHKPNYLYPSLDSRSSYSIKLDNLIFKW